VSSDPDADPDESTAAGRVRAPDATADPDTAESEAEVAATPDTAETEADGFGWRGWALTAVLFCCVLVIPGIIYVYPYAAGALGFPFLATFLALPLVPALLLGLVAVWSMTAAPDA